MALPAPTILVFYHQPIHRLPRTYMLTTRATLLDIKGNYTHTYTARYTGHLVDMPLV